MVLKGSGGQSPKFFTIRLASQINNQKGTSKHSYTVIPERKVFPRSNRANLRGEGPELPRVSALTVHTHLQRTTAPSLRDPTTSLGPFPRRFLDFLAGKQGDEIHASPLTVHLLGMATWELQRLNNGKTHTLPLILSKISSPYLGILPALGITFSFCSLEILYQQFPSLKFKKKKNEREGKKKKPRIVPSCQGGHCLH